MNMSRLIKNDIGKKFVLFLNEIIVTILNNINDFSMNLNLLFNEIIDSVINKIDDFTTTFSTKI